MSRFVRRRQKQNPKERMEWEQSPITTFLSINEKPWLTVPMGVVLMQTRKIPGRNLHHCSVFKMKAI